MIGGLNLTGESVGQIMTHPGQAHFAVDGVHTCRECEHWASKGQRDKARLLKPAQCLKAPKEYPAIPHQAWACRYFELSPAPPPV
ncbi:MAG TPA: hypothetical protein VGG86_20835 [Roseiarcus sp.]